VLSGARFVYEDKARDDVLGMIPTDGSKILSIGCGTGSTEWELAKAGREVHGVDILEEAVEVARGRLASMTLTSPGERLPFDEASFDGLILADVIEHIPGAWTALAEFSRFVKVGGWVVISVPNMRGWDVFSQFVLRGDWPEKQTGIFDATHVQMMSEKRLARWCEGAGLKPERWVDRYDPNGPRRLFLSKWANRLTLGLMRSWWMYQIQVVCWRVR